MRLFTVVSFLLIFSLVPPESMKISSVESEPSRTISLLDCFPCDEEVPNYGKITQNGFDEVDWDSLYPLRTNESETYFVNEMRHDFDENSQMIEHSFRYDIDEEEEYWLYQLFRMEHQQ